MDKVLLVLIGLACIVFIWLIWMRQMLLHHYRDVLALRDILLTDMSKRRDIVPYLLESCRYDEKAQGTWHSMVTARAHFHGLSTLDDEWNFEKQLLEFLHQNPSKNVNFLEAKRDIEEATERIRRENLEYLHATEHLNQEIKRFPYSLASAIFGFRKLSS